MSGCKNFHKANFINMPNSSISSSSENLRFHQSSEDIRKIFSDKSKEIEKLLTEEGFYTFLISKYMEFILKQIPRFEKNVEASAIDEMYQEFYQLSFSFGETAEDSIIKNRELMKWWDDIKDILLKVKTDDSKKSNFKRNIGCFTTLEKIHSTWEKIQDTYNQLQTSPLNSSTYLDYLSLLASFKEAHKTLSKYFPHLSSHSYQLSDYINTAQLSDYIDTAINFHHFYNTPNPKTKQLIVDIRRYHETVIRLDADASLLASYSERIKDCLITADSQFASFTNLEHDLYSLANEWLSARIHQDFQKSDQKINAFIQMIAAEEDDNTENPAIKALINHVKAYHTTLNSLHTQEDSLVVSRKKIQDCLNEYYETCVKQLNHFNRWEHHLYRLAIQWNNTQIQGTDEEIQTTEAEMKAAIDLVNDYLPKEKTAEEKEKEEEKKAASLASEKEQNSLQLNDFFKNADNNPQKKTKLTLRIP